MLQDGVLSETASPCHCRLMTLAPSLTAFGNTNPLHISAWCRTRSPDHVCWGEYRFGPGTRASGLDQPKDLCSQPIPEAKKYYTPARARPSRCVLRMAPQYRLLLAGLAVACRHGFELPDALDIAQRTYVQVNIHKGENQALLQNLAVLPDSCAASADCLEQQRQVYEAYNVFSPAMLDGIISNLRSYNDANLRRDLAGDPERTLALVQKYFHCG